MRYFDVFGGDISPIPPNLDSDSTTISIRFRWGTKLFWKLPFRVESVANSRLSAFQCTKNHQKPFTEFGDRVHQRCRHRSVTDKQCQPYQIWTILFLYPSDLLFCSILVLNWWEPSLVPTKTILDHRRSQIWSEIPEFHHFEVRGTRMQTVRDTFFTSISERFCWETKF